ncbi:MAG TPA: hypothetical protein VJ550_10775 [Geomonas sp.]|nr:hypothetical protein [Geomonas sp.]
MKLKVWLFILLLLASAPRFSWSEDKYAVTSYRGAKTGLVMTDYGGTTYELIEESDSPYKRHTLIGITMIMDLPVEKMDQKVLDCFSEAGRKGAYVRLSGTIQRAESDGSEGFKEITGCSVVTERN